MQRIGSRAVWLTRQAGQAGDPSLRLKNGYAQDDTAIEGAKLRHYLAIAYFAEAAVPRYNFRVCDMEKTMFNPR